MNYLLISVLVLGIGCMVLGYMKGFIRIVMSLVATIITLVIVGMFTPTVANVLIDYTPLDDAVRNNFENMFFGDDIYLENSTSESTEFSLSQQLLMIESAMLPDFLKEAIIEDNNSEIYEQVGAETFQEYIGIYLTNWVMKVISFIVTFLLAWVVVRVIFFSLIVISDLPLLHGINRGIGTVLGLGFAIVIVWIGYLGMAVMYSNTFAQQCYVWVEESKILTFLYDINPIWKLLM